MGEESKQGGGHLIRFDGSKPEDYEEWEIYARSHLRKKERGGMPKEALGDELVTMITPNSPAFKTIKKIKNFNEIIQKPGAEKLIFQALAKRYPKQTDKEKQNKALADVKDLRPRKDEKSKKT